MFHFWVDDNIVPSQTWMLYVYWKIVQSIIAYIEISMFHDNIVPSQTWMLYVYWKIVQSIIAYIEISMFHFWV